MNFPVIKVHSGRPLVAGVMVDSIDTRKVKRAKGWGADLIEVRLDTFKERDAEKLSKGLRNIRSAGVGVLLTIRSVKEGGRLSIGDAERLSLFSSLVGEADLVDIELSSKRILSRVAEVVKGHGKGLIVSYHNFRKTPGAAKLEETIKRCRQSGADLVKIAAQAGKKEDVRILARFLLESDDIIAISMGGIGAFTRVFFPAIGSRITYGAITRSTAPGQLGLKELTGELVRYGII